MVKHLKKTDPGYSLNASSVVVYKCPSCDREEATESNKPLDLSMSNWCPDCELRGKLSRMVGHQRIQSKKVDEIKNRVNSSESQEYKPVSMDVMWDEDMVPKWVKTSFPSSGDGGKHSITVIGRTSRETWKENVVQFIFPNGTKAYYRLADIGEALKPMISEVL